MGVPEIRRLKPLEDENKKLKRLFADVNPARMAREALRNLAPDVEQSRTAKNNKARQ